MALANAPDLLVLNLFKSYERKPAVLSMSFTVKPGEIVGLLGPNGAGKTTIIESIAGLIEPSAGRIEVCGIDLKSNPADAKQKLGTVLQSTTLQDKITPREALDFFGSLYAGTVSSQQLLQRFGLQESANAAFDSLSGGQKQRFALALSCVGNPQLFLLDEPTTGLDPVMRHEVHNYVRQMKHEGRSILLATHDMEEAESLCDRILVINEGRIVAEGTPQKLIAETGSTMRIIVQSNPSFNAAWIDLSESIAEAEASTTSITIPVAEVNATLMKITAALDAHHAELISLRVFKATLEDVIRKLAGSKAS